MLFQAKNSGNGSDDAILYTRVRPCFILFFPPTYPSHSIRLKPSISNDPVKAPLLSPRQDIPFRTACQARSHPYQALRSTE